MREETTYEFDHFRLDPLRRRLLHNGQPRALTPTAFDLLCVLVKNNGQVVSKKDLISSVWSGSFVTDNNFNVTLAAVRRALEESGRNPTYIFKVGDGYRFVGNVREVAPGVDDNTDETAARLEEVVTPPAADSPKWTEPAAPIAHRQRYSAHVVLGSFLYGMLYAIALILEIAYKFDLYGEDALRIAPAVLIWIAGCSALSLKLDQKLTIQGKRGGMPVSIMLFLLAAAALFVALTRFLPAVPITESTLQAYPAQAAYLKDMSYFLILAVCFLILPFHFVVSLQREIQQGKGKEVLALLTGNKLSAFPIGIIFVRPWMLGALLLVLAAFSLVMTSNLLDHLRHGPYTNLFTQLVYARALVYFALGLECVVWYAKALNELALRAHRSERDIRAR